MEDNKSSLDLVLILALLAGAVTLIDDQLIRTAVTIVPALLLVQRAGARPSAPSASRVVPTSAIKERTKEQVRMLTTELQKHVKELYTTCHLVTAGQLTPEDAKEKTSAIERNLNLLLAKLSDPASG